MFCSNCGARLTEGANFCNKCGAKVFDTKKTSDDNSKMKDTLKSTADKAKTVGNEVKNSKQVKDTVSWLSWNGRRNRKNYLFTELGLLMIRRVVGVFPNVIFTLGFSYLSLVNRMKRLQDMNYAGWWLIAYQLILSLYEASVPFIIGVSLIYNIWEAAGNVKDIAIQKFVHDFASTLLTYYAPIIFDAVFALILAVKRGTVGSNKYGPDSVSE